MINKIKRTLLFVFSFNSIFLFSQDYSPKSSREIITHNYYSLSYNEYHEKANWVHYKLRKTLILGAFDTFYKYISALNKNELTENIYNEKNHLHHSPFFTNDDVWPKPYR